jgi:hypothetical protein
MRMRRRWVETRGMLRCVFWELWWACLGRDMLTSSPEELENVLLGITIG